MSARMPVLFVGHGSPTNAIEDNRFTRGWKRMAGLIPRPRAILSVSAHWYVDGTKALSAERPRTLHDFWGFPNEMYELEYPAPGSADIAGQAVQFIRSTPAVTDDSWGLDHGTWAVLINMYPEADIPVLQLSLNYDLSSAAHFAIGRELQPLREAGVLIMGSGNIVHNLGMADPAHQDRGFDWAEYFDILSQNLILNGDADQLINYGSLGPTARQAVPTPDHYWPLLYTLGAAEPSDSIEIFNAGCVFSSVSMTSVIIGL